MSEITVDTEKALRALEKVDKAMAELRAVLAPGVFKEVTRKQRPENNEHNLLRIPRRSWI